MPPPERGQSPERAGIGGGGADTGRGDRPAGQRGAECPDSPDGTRMSGGHEAGGGGSGARHLDARAVAENVSGPLA
jgi:hypothetical protein